MRLLIKQKAFSWTDTYNIYDEKGEEKYFVKAEFLSLTYKLHVYDKYRNEIGVIHQKMFSIMPVFEIEMGGRMVGNIQKKFSFFTPKYEIDCNGWRVQGDFLGWDYDVYSGCSQVIHISKELLHWGDTYVLNFQNPDDEIMGLLLVIAIDAANCSEGE